MRLIWRGVNALLTSRRSWSCRGGSIARKDSAISRNNGGSRSKITPWPETKVSLSRLTRLMSAWRTTAQKPGSSGSGTTAPSIGRCQDTGCSARSWANTSSISRAGRAQNDLLETSMSQ